MVWHVLLGAAVGLLVLQPINDLILYFQAGPEGATVAGYVGQALMESILGPRWLKGGFYTLIGAALGGITGAVSRQLLTRQRRVAQLTIELERELVALLAKGEGQRVEFKSSFRWDVQTGKVLKLLEHAVIKSIAGFLNADGGTLLIGVTDDARVLGLRQDYGTLKKRDRDGFEQAIMTAVATKLGADTCAQVRLVFHTVEGEELCRVIVSPSPRPVYLSQGKETEFYVRTGASTRQLNVQEAIEYIKTRWPD
jgi:hypothetical protein